MKLLQIGLVILLAFGVVSFGAVDVWAQSILESGAGLLLVWWATIFCLNKEMKIRWTPLNWPLLSFIAIAALQMLFASTASAFLTRTQLLRFVAYFIVFFLIAQAFRTRNDWSALAWSIVAFCFAVSLLGIIQHFTSQNEIYWMRSFRTEVRPFGPYVNRNDFAGFVELTLPIGLALMILRGVHKDLFPLLALLTIVPISADVLSSSRGGIMSLAFAIGVLVLLAIRRRAGSKKGKSSRAIAFGLALLVALAFVAWVGVGKTIQRFSNLNHPEITLARRISMARAALHIFAAHPLAGCGLGALVDVFPRYDTDYDARVVDHVHNDYLEVLAEAGLLGAVCGLSFLWLLSRAARANFEAEQGHFSRALHAGAIAAVCAMLLHSVVDFNLHIPGNALLFLLQVSIVASPRLPAATRSRAIRASTQAEQFDQALSFPSTQ
jgi:O-antigen ligase